MERQTTHRRVETVDVFISHAGPDKFFIARPLSKKLETLGLNCFLDRIAMEPGDHGPDEMTQAMNSAKVGVFILSPEFAARKWTMRELRCFLRRRTEAKSTGTPPPVLIPVFYRLSIRECRELQLDQYQDDDGRNIFEVEKFYSEERQREATTEEVKIELRELADTTGIENLDKATNSLHDEFAYYLRENLVGQISRWVEQKCEEQGHHRVGGEDTPSAEGTARITGAVCDTSDQQRDFGSVKNESEREEFTPSFDVPKNPPHVILKFGQDSEGGNKIGINAPPEELLKRKLLVLDGPQSVGAIGEGSGKTVAMKGIGGIGKSCALRSLAADPNIRKKFCDGIYWVVLGQDATKRGVIEQLTRIIMESGGDKQAKAVREESELDSAVSRVKKWFKGKTILLLIDDVWRDAEVGSCAATRLQEIADAEKGSCMAFTAREWGLVTGSEEIGFSLKEDASSLEILLKSAAIRKEDIEGLRNPLEKILRFCGGHPLALSVVGKAIRTHREIANELCLKDVLEEYLKDLEDSPAGILDETVDGYIYKNLTSAFSASLSMIDRNKGRGDVYPMSYTEMYESLVVIQRQGWLPLTVLCALWGLNRKEQAIRVLREFVKASLVERRDRVFSDDRWTAGVRLHDLQLDYVQQRCGNGGEKKWHEKLIREWEWKEGEYTQGASWYSWRRWKKWLKRLVQEWVWKETEYTQGVAWVCGMKWKADIVGGEYFRENLCRHLKGAQLMDELRDVLKDPRWAAERLTRGEGSGLQDDFKIFTGVDGEEGEECEEGDTVWSLRKIGREARLSASYVIRHSREVWFQLHYRLLRFNDISELIREYLSTIEKVVEKPWLKSLTPRTNASDAVQDIFVNQGWIEGVSGCVEKNEMTAWGRDGEHLFRRTFQNGEVKKNVTCEVPKYAESIWSQNGKFVAVVRLEGGVQVWDLHTGVTAQRVGQEFNLRVYLAPKHWDLTGDGKRLAHGQEGSKVMLWDVETGRKVKEVGSGWNYGFRKVSFSPDGKRLISAGESGSYLMLCGETGEKIMEYDLPEMDEYVQAWSCNVCWSRNGRRFAYWLTRRTSELAGRLLIFDGQTGENIWDEETSQDAYVESLLWSQDEERLWFIQNGELCVWDGDSGRIIKKVELSRGQSFSKMSLTADEKWFAVSGVSSIEVRDAETGTLIWSDVEQHHTHVNVVAWLEDAKRMFSADSNGKIVIWEWNNLERVRSEKGCKENRKVTAVAWSSDDTCTTAVGEDGDVFMYDVKTGKVVWRDVKTHVSAVRCLEISGDNRRVFSRAKDGKVATWNTTSGEKMWQGRIGREDENYFRTACWSNDGMRVLAWTEASMTLWDGETGEKLWEGSADTNIASVAWCGDDTKIACGDWGGKVVVRSSRTGEIVGDAVGHHQGYVDLVEWSADDKWIASGSRFRSESQLIIWNWETGATIWSPEESLVSCLEWSNDGRCVAYGLDKLVIWNFETGQMIEEDYGLEVGDWLKFICWSWDGGRVATLSFGRKLRVSDVTRQGIFLVQQYDDVACFDQIGLRQMIDAKEGELSTELERKLKIRWKRDGVFYSAGDEKIHLASTVAHGQWHCSTSCRHIAVREPTGLRESELYFYEILE